MFTLLLLYIYCTLSIEHVDSKLSGSVYEYGFFFKFDLLPILLIDYHVNVPRTTSPTVHNGLQYVRQ